MSELRYTALHALHCELGARMVPFAGYSMPVQYPLGVLKEHLHTRRAAGLFDVSHMGQLQLVGEMAPVALETLVPVDLVDLAPHQQRYALFTNAAGGILDDLMVTRVAQGLFVVVNAACKEADTAHLRASIGSHCKILELSEHALLALQGPAAVGVMQRVTRGVDFAGWTFMTGRTIDVAGTESFVTRSGYTGEDGFEISLPNDAAERVARALLAQPEVAAIGLGARDSLRLEAGLCLYGHDITATTTPVEASLGWALSKARRAEGKRKGGYPGAERILEQLQNGTAVRRVGLLGSERTPIREGTQLEDANGHRVGEVTSGGFGPSRESAIAMAYLPSAQSQPETSLFARVRERAVPVRVVKTPFVPNRYYRGQA